MEDQNDSKKKASDQKSDDAAASDFSLEPYSFESPETPAEPSPPAESVPAESPPAGDFDLSGIPGLNAASEEAATPAASEPPVKTAAEAEPQPEAKAELNAIEQVKAFSENVQMEKVEIPAAFPFSLHIEGHLSPEEREKLLDVISRENMGFREVDLEPQFASGKILIPRISEYAGILLVQALRGTSTRMRLGPSDSIFATPETSAESDPISAHLMGTGAQAYVNSAETVSHPAEDLPLTTEATLSQLKDAKVIDTLVATALVESSVVEARCSDTYTSVIEDLKREIKYKAHRKGAHGVVNFRIDLQQLSLATQYRATATGTAVKGSSRGKEPSAEELFPL